MRRPLALTVAALVAALALAPSLATDAAAKPCPVAPVTYGTYEHPYAADSLVNSIPVNPTLDSWQIPDTGAYAWINQGAYGITVVQAKASDPAVTILPLTGEPGVWDPDSEAQRPSVTMPHFPAGVLPPHGTDGSVAIHDSTTGVIYNFWQLRHYDDGTWHAKQASWSRIDGQGFANPAHYFQGARATGTDNLIGLLRPEEYGDGAPMYYHALASTLDGTGLAPGKTPGTVGYVWPATSGDGWGATPTGKIPEGARMFLPKDFPVDSLKSVQLRKIARTLQVYGTYIVDRNFGTPITFDAANVPGWRFELGDTPYDNPDLDDAGDWAAYEASGVPQQLDDIRKALRMMTSNRGYTTGGGKHINPRPGQRVNLLSMRGPWTMTAGHGEAGTFNTSTQRVEFTTAGITQQRTGRWQRVDWALLQPGERVKLQVSSTRGATVQLTVTCDGRAVIHTRALKNGQRVQFAWPSCADPQTTWTISSGRGNSWVTAQLVRH